MNEDLKRKGQAQFFFTLTLIVIPMFSWGQTSKLLTINGRVMDFSGSAIPYCHVTVSSDNSQGTYSNSEGDFVFKASNSFVNDSLMFSCVGYRPQRVKIASEMDTLTVRLEMMSFMLNEIVISSDTALNIIKESIKSLGYNLPKESCILQGFFREIIRSHDTYDRLVEAAIDVYDKGFKNNGNESLQFKIKEIRKSEDYIDLDWRGAIYNYLKPRNGLHGEEHESLFSSDYIRYNSNQFVKLLNAPLNNDFFDFVNFNIDSTVVYERDTVIRIGIYPKEVNDDYVPGGFIDIRKKDYSFLQMVYILNLSENISPKFRSLFTVPDQDFIHKTIIKYKEFEGKMYLNFLYRKSFRLQMNHTKFRKSKGAEGMFYDEKYFVTNEIITEKGQVKKFRRKDRQKSDMDLYSENWVYNESFWKDYNVINERPLKPNIKSDLEHERSLEEQFKKNE